MLKDDLEKCKEKHLLTSFYSDRDDTDSFSVGYIQGISDKYVLTESISKYGNYDGFDLRLLNRIFSAEWGGLYEHIFLQDILNRFGNVLPVNCMITDLDTDCPLYEAYFEKNNYYVFDRLTTASIFAFDLTSNEIQDVISNWGYFTIDAVFALGIVDDELKKSNIDCENVFKSLPVVISQVLDYSIDIAVHQYYYKDISRFLVTD